MSDQAITIIEPTVLDQERVKLLSNYHAQDHLAKWMAFDKRQSKNVEVIYYPAAWRLYELSLRYGDANFSCEIAYMDAEKDFVIIKARLYLGASYEASPKKAEAYKQGRLTELDRVETKAKARAARDFGIGTEHALDMDDLEAGSVEGGAESPKVKVVNSDKPSSVQPSSDLAKTPLGQRMLRAKAVGYIVGSTPEELKASWEIQIKQIFGELLSEEELSKSANLARINGSIESHIRLNGKAAVAAK